MPPKTKWDDKMEKDLLMAIRVAESGYNPVTRDTWTKATEVMKMLGYTESTWTGISQRWSKFTQKTFQHKYPHALEVVDGTFEVVPATAAAQAPATTASGSGSGSGAAPARRARAGRPSKREREEEEEEVHEEENHEDDDEEVPAPAKKARVSKRQKKN